MRNQWFGQAIDAPVCEILEHVPPPVGQLCLFCGNPIRENDYGVMILNLCSELLGEAFRSPAHHGCLVWHVGGRIPD